MPRQRQHDRSARSENMETFNVLLERHHRPIIVTLALVVVFFAAACMFHDVIPICHYLFGCDHGLHAAA